MNRLIAVTWMYAAMLACATGSVPAFAGGVTGGDALHTVRKGEYLILVAARHGVPDSVLARDNGVRGKQLLHPGQTLRVDNRHIVPDSAADGVVVNIPQRMLYLFRDGRLVVAYPVGLGKASWPTPTGSFLVRSKAVDKEWVVPESIQAEMREEGKPVLTRVPPGPDNPLGRYWIGLSPGAWGIHGTIAPASIYHFQSHGCIRLHPNDIEALYPQIARGDAVSLIYQPVLLDRDGEGTLYLEVHRNIYNQAHDPWQVIMDRALELDAVEEIDWARAEAVVNAAEGIARKIGGEPMRDEGIN